MSRKWYRYIYIVVVIVALVITFVPKSRQAEDSASYFRDMEYIGIYQVSNGVFGSLLDVFGIPKNSNHLIISGLRFTGGETFSVLSLTLIYFALLAISVYLAIKRCGKFGLIAAPLLILALLNRHIIRYIFTIIPLGGIAVFFYITAAQLVNIRLKNSLALHNLVLLTLSAFVFCAFDTVTAFCGAVFGVLIILLCETAESKPLKLAAAVCGGVIIAVSLVFAVTYRDVNYAENLHNAYMYSGIIDSGGYSQPSSYVGLLKMYLSGDALSNFPDFTQSLLNNAFVIGGEQPFNLWFIVKRTLIPMNNIVFFVIILGSIALSIKCAHDKTSYRGIAGLIIGLSVMCVVSLIVPGIIYGMANMDKTLFLFNRIFEFLIITDLVSAAYIISDRRAELRRKYGVTQ